MGITHTQSCYGFTGNDCVWLPNAGVPDANVGKGVAGKGSLCSDTTNGELYINAGTKATPAWKKVTKSA